MLCAKYCVRETRLIKEEVVLSSNHIQDPSLNNITTMCQP